MSSSLRPPFYPIFLHVGQLFLPIGLAEVSVPATLNFSSISPSGIFVSVVHISVCCDSYRVATGLDSPFLRFVNVGTALPLQTWRNHV
jgi:hypothetical protein